jgi:hypothetical protein
MTRFLQSLLTLALILVAFQIVSSAYVFFAMNRLRDYDPGPELRSNVHARLTWNHWPFALGRAWKFDSSTHSGSMAPFIGFTGARLAKSPDEKMELVLDGEQQRTLMWDHENYPSVFLSEQRFNSAKTLCIFLFVLELAITFYIWRTLFGFVGCVGRKEFFNPKNGARLRIIGWFITALGSFTFLRPFLSLWLFDLFTGTGPLLMVRFQENFGNLYWVIAGILLLVIAEAFRKGNQLQTEQEFTI